MIKVQLKEDEITVCQLMGRMRNLIARSAGVKISKVGGQNGADADVQGFKGEYAFCKHFNIFPDMGLSVRSGSFDCLLKGVRFDIKSTVHKNGRLITPMKVNPDVDAYALAIVERDVVTFIGYAMKEDFITPEHIVDLGMGDTYVMERSELKQFKNQ